MFLSSTKMRFFPLAVSYWNLFESVRRILVIFFFFLILETIYDVHVVYITETPYVAITQYIHPCEQLS